MAETGLGSVKRFGTRYGRTVKHKLAKIEAGLRGKHKCPYCAKQKVKRVAMGIWNCQKCSTTFTARAYEIGEKISIAERAAELAAAQPAPASEKQE